MQKITSSKIEQKHFNITFELLNTTTHNLVMKNRKPFGDKNAKSCTYI